MNTPTHAQGVVVFCPACGEKFSHDLANSGKLTGVLGGAGAGAWLGSGVGIAAGPLGAIAGTIPGAIVGAILGDKASAVLARACCPRCDFKFAVPSTARPLPVGEAEALKARPRARQESLASIGIALSNIDVMLREEVNYLSTIASASIPDDDDRFISVLLGVGDAESESCLNCTLEQLSNEERAYVLRGLPRSRSARCHELGNSKSVIRWRSLGRLVGLDLRRTDNAAGKRLDFGGLSRALLAGSPYDYRPSFLSAAEVNNLSRNLEFKFDEWVKIFHCNAKSACDAIPDDWDWFEESEQFALVVEAFHLGVDPASTGQRFGESIESGRKQL